MCIIMLSLLLRKTCLVKERIDQQVIIPHALNKRYKLLDGRLGCKVVALGSCHFCLYS